MNKYNLKVGQKLYIPDRRIHGRVQTISEYEVKKVGRVYATLDRGWSRVELETLKLDSDYTGSTRFAYLSREAYEEEQRLTAAWSQLCADLRHRDYRPPPNISVATIQQVRILLGLDT